jgi:ribose 5-phosphate isomerase A
VNPKQIAAEHAVTLIKDGMSVGLGSGTTAAYAIPAVARRIETEGLRLRCVATSKASAHLAHANGIKLSSWDSIETLDITIDGADEIDPEFRIIKGGGGALVREKLVATVTADEVIVVHSAKLTEALGAFPVPVAVVPFGWPSTRRRLAEKFGCEVSIRRDASGDAFTSDDGMHILDMAFGAPLPRLDTIENEIRSVVGVVEVGLFFGLCHHLVVAHSDGSVEVKAAPK